LLVRCDDFRAENMEENADQKIATTESPPSYDSIAPTRAAAPQPAPQPVPYPPTAVPPPYPAPPPGAYGTPTYYYVPAGPVYPVPRRQPVQSFMGHICFACIVLWCCNWVFGLIAFILASSYTRLLSLACIRSLEKGGGGTHPSTIQMKFTR